MGRVPKLLSDYSYTLRLVRRNLETSQLGLGSQLSVRSLGYLRRRALATHPQPRPRISQRRSIWGTYETRGRCWSMSACCARPDLSRASLRLQLMTHTGIRHRLTRLRPEFRPIDSLDRRGVKLLAPHSPKRPHQMTGERIPRRLAAILAADVVGYSRLMQHVEAGTLASRSGAQRRFLVSKHRGREVKLRHDTQRGLTCRLNAPV
jgi:hypothetical protein